MTPEQWKPILSELSRMLLEIDLACPEENRFYSREQHAAGLVREGASESELAELEGRLGLLLPETYRSFLQCSNGFAAIDGVLVSGELKVVSQVVTLKDMRPELVEIWTDDPEDDMRLRVNSISITETADATGMFLCPEVTDDAGEMECWGLASWYPSTRRFASFEMWMGFKYKVVWQDWLQKSRWQAMSLKLPPQLSQLSEAERRLFLECGEYMGLIPEVAFNAWAVPGQTPLSFTSPPFSQAGLSDANPSPGYWDTALGALLDFLHSHVAQFPDMLAEIPELFSWTEHGVQGETLTFATRECRNRFYTDVGFAEVPTQQERLYADGAALLPRIKVLNGKFVV